MPDSARCDTANDLVGRADGAGVAHVNAVYERMPEATPEHTRAVLAAVLEVFADTPELARMCVVEVAAAGPKSLNRLLNTVGRVHRTAAGQHGALPPARGGRRPRHPDPVTRKALVGGIHWVIYDRIVSGQTEGLPELLPPNSCSPRSSASGRQTRSPTPDPHASQTLQRGPPLASASTGTRARESAVPA